MIYVYSLSIVLSINFFNKVFSDLNNLLRIAFNSLYYTVCIKLQATFCSLMECDNNGQLPSPLRLKVEPLLDSRAAAVRRLSRKEILCQPLYRRKFSG